MDHILIRDLSLALSTQDPGLRMFLQPQYSPQGQVIGAELLARWMHPIRGEVSPALFIPLAEQTDLIQAVSRWTLSTACQTLKALEHIGETYPVSINISPKLFLDRRFTEKVYSILQQTGIKGDRLIFEITEGVLIQDVESAVVLMTELNQLGIRFSIDDFGTGYSSLAYLNHLPLYELKIDKSLVQNLTFNASSDAIIELILGLADRLGLHVVAEGIETMQQRDFLVAKHAHCALQGYLLARPMPIDTWLNGV